jgi:predicted metal-dependent phosphoesterase TrpH
VRCDLHVHTFHSGMCGLPVLKAFCRESYSPPEEVYQQLKRQGMSLVTVTDHDSIDAAEELRSHPDFFLSEEVTCSMPSGTELHVGVYDISEHDHVEIQRRRTDLPRLMAYLAERGIFFSINHAFSGLTGRREREDFEWMERAMAIEALNGAVPAANNRQAARFARRKRKIAIGGSDAHTLRSLGCAYTEVPGALNKNEFLQGLRFGLGRVGGEPGNYWKLTREILLITAAMMAERPAVALLAGLTLGIPAVTLGIRIQESRFVSKWRRELWGNQDAVKALVGRPRVKPEGAVA